MQRALPAWLRLLVFSGMLAISSVVSAAPRVLIITQAFEGPHAETLAALRHALAGTEVELKVQLASAPSLQHEPASIVVTIGSEAAALAAASPSHTDTPILHTLLPASTVPAPTEGRARTIAIVLDQPATRLVTLLRLALPQTQTVALIAGPSSELAVDRVRAAAQDAGLKVRQSHIDNSDALFPALQHVLVEPAVLVTIPDAVVFNRYTVQNILLTTFRRRSPVLGFSAAYVRAGALLGLYSTPTQVGEDAADAVLDLIAGRPRPALSPPQRFEVGVNNTVARALGLELPTAESLMRELRRVEASAP